MLKNKGKSNVLPKRLNSFLYTVGRRQKGSYYFDDKENPYLYAKGIYRTTITKEDLTDDYVRIFSSSISYSNGYLKTSGVVDIKYKAMKLNHLFKDDALYISYNKPINLEVRSNGIEIYSNYDFALYGNDIIKVLLYIEKNSSIYATDIKTQILDKIEWYINKYDDYKGTPIKIFKSFANLDDDSKLIGRDVIVSNKIKCLSCGEVIESFNRHDFKMCKCGKVGVDGGYDYLRRTGNLEDFEDLSEFDYILEDKEIHLS